MELSNTGPLAVSAIKSVYGNYNARNTISTYYGSCSGVPGGGPLSFSHLRGKKLATQHPPGDMTANSTAYTQSGNDAYGTAL